MVFKYKEGKPLSISVFVLLCCLISYSVFQSIKINSLNEKVIQKNEVINLLEKSVEDNACIAISEQVSPKASGNKVITTYKSEVGGHIANESLTAVSLVEYEYQESADIDDIESDYLSPDKDNIDELEHIDPQDVREAFSGIFDKTEISSYSDKELLTEGSALLSRHIENEESDIESSLMAADMMVELTNSPIPEDLSHALLTKAIASKNEDNIVETLLVIDEQGYSNSNQLVAELIETPDTNARMLGVYLLTKNKSASDYTAILADQLYTNPKETIEVLNRLIGD